jgi:hypothetical protein
MGVLDVYNVENVDKVYLDSIKTSLELFKINNPEQMCVSCIQYLKSSKSTLKADLDNHTFTSLYDEAQNERVREALKHIITRVLHTFFENNDHNGDFIFESWINMICYQQEYIYNNEFHDHYSINVMDDRFIPDKSIVFYIQIPNCLLNYDGVLFYKIKDEVKYILPKECEMIVMNSKISHLPNNAPHTTLDRIALGINIKLLK